MNYEMYNYSAQHNYGPSVHHKYNFVIVINNRAKQPCLSIPCSVITLSDVLPQGILILLCKLTHIMACSFVAAVPQAWNTTNLRVLPRCAFLESGVIYLRITFKSSVHPPPKLPLWVSVNAICCKTRILQY